MIPVRVQQAFLAVAALLLAAWAGYSGAQSGWVIQVGLAGLLLFAVTQRVTAVSGETILLSLLCFGYIVGNRGFAQLNLFGIFIGEFCLAACLCLMLMHIPLKRQLPLRMDAMGWWVAVSLALGAARLLPSLRPHGMLAVRDFAVLYYALFFLAAQPMIRHPQSFRFFERALAISLGVLPFTFALFELAGDFLVRNLTLFGVPLIFYKGDNVATFLGLGSLFFTFRYWRTQSVLALVLAGLSLLLMLHASARAAILAYACASAVALAAGRWRLLRLQAVVAGIGLLGAVFLMLATRQPFSESKLNSLFEHAISLVDFEGSYNYSSPQAADSGDNNRFRLVWWNSVLRDTINERPLTGLGFGSDLATPFLDEYYGMEVDGFTARSPHSVLVTIMGRMGAMGMALYALLIGLMLRATLRIVRRERAGATSDTGLVYICCAWMIFVSACFGVVLEGPMGAIPFWICLSIAWDGSRQEAPEEEEESKAQVAPGAEVLVSGER